VGDYATGSQCWARRAAVTIVLLFCERFFHIGIFDRRWAATPSLPALFWFTRIPRVHHVLPAMGVISEVSRYSAQRPFGYASSRMPAWLSPSSVSGVGHICSSHAMVYAGLVFSFLSYFVAIPPAIKFSLTATLTKDSHLMPPHAVCF